MAHLRTANRSIHTTCSKSDSCARQDSENGQSGKLSKVPHAFLSSNEDCPHEREPSGFALCQRVFPLALGPYLTAEPLQDIDPLGFHSSTRVLPTAALGAACMRTPNGYVIHRLRVWNQHQHGLQTTPSKLPLADKLRAYLRQVPFNAEYFGHACVQPDPHVV